MTGRRRENRKRRENGKIKWKNRTRKCKEEERK